jgi:ribosomal protein L29
MSKLEERQALQDRSLAELYQDLKEARQELFQNRFRYATRNLDNPEPLRKGKKKIARILTYITQKERAGDA